MAAFGGEPEVQEWEIAVLHREHALRDGGAARLTWAQLDGAPEQFVEAFRTRLMPKLEEMPGFCSVSLLTNRDMGRVVGTVSFESREALERTREQARSLRENVTGSMGATVTDVAEMDVALAHLRVPETV
ncbi:antibiotic biosynthesis monooxygenase [Blastococcus sp. URHD0036]|uniref:antibiotic biosynthesis monooxygenase n=1 Tax=Blastococcus sp. URHD0036 TaxID=1380356 RepID=UPI00068BC534|nr:antibiotic biosynthesis monooxygenase [Blastococcus sp. URHD0036]